jgi:hypothetical protein
MEQRFERSNFLTKLKQPKSGKVLADIICKRPRPGVHFALDFDGLLPGKSKYRNLC